ncbi:MAG TPA: hypothetical protein VFG30_40545 [Polyangiales bacterium]|nr:hypothetical protein [Polyangiales bacterium]
MRRRAPAVGVALVLVSLSGCWSTDPDYVAMTRPPQCDVRSRLVRRGFPENLDAVLAGSCTVTRMDPMRGPDFTRWLAGTSSAIMTCDSPVPIPFWTEKSPEGKITKVHFCPEFCEDLRITLKEQIMLDLICEEDAGQRGVAGATLPPSSGTVAPPLDAGTSFVTPAAGTGGVAATSGSGGASGQVGAAGAAAGSGGVGAAGSTALAGTSGAAGFGVTAGAGGAGGST